MVAQRYAAPVKPAPAQAPGFRRVKADVGTKKQAIKQHQPATTESKAAQDAAVAPPDDKEAQGKAAQAEKMNAAEPGEFNKQAFIDAVNKAIAAQAPKNLNEADKFADSGKADQVKEQVDGKVTDGKKTSAKEIETTTKAAPDTSKAKTKKVTPMTADKPPGKPGAPSAADAVPDKQPPAVTDFSAGPKANDAAMADAEVTEEQLAKGNEPQFNEALSEKKKAEAHSTKAGPQGRQAENQELTDAKAGAAAAGASAMASLTATRTQAGQQVDGGKGETKSKDEKKREEVTAKLQKVFDAAKKDVESTLSGLDKKVDDQFAKGEKAARDAFTEDHKRRMKKYKDKRYSGFRGKLRWVKDKFKGLPQEGLNIFQESRKLYVSKMQTVISSIADTIGTELGKAKARIKQGRTELKTEVDKLPQDLKQYGQEAAKDFEGKFEDLEAKVNEKSDELVQTLAQKYTEALNKVDEEIKKLQDENKGLIAKAKDAIVGAIKTILELKNLLMGILAKAASAIGKIIKDPIGFLGNLVKAVSAGLNLFTSNILDHLKKGLVAWLLGTATKEGIEIPAKFDMKGIIQLVVSMLGLTWDNLRARIVAKGVPEPAMEKVEQSVPVAGALSREGPAGAMDEIQADTGDLKTKILDDLKSYLVPTVIIAGISWIISLLTPASAFVRAVKGIIDIITFIVNQGAQIVEFVNAVLDAVIAIAGGGSAGVPKMVEAALAASIPLLIGFLAALVGVGGLANKVKSVLRAAGRPVKRAIDKLVGVIARKGKGIWSKLRKKLSKDERRKDKNAPESESQEDKQQRLNKAIAAASKALSKNSGRLVSATTLRPMLNSIKKRYRLAELTAQEEGDTWKVDGAVNPRRRKDTELETKKVFVSSIKKSLLDYAPNKYVGDKVYKDWAQQIEKSKVGGQSIWTRGDLNGTENESLKYLEKSSTHKELLGYFNKKRSKDLAETKEFTDYTFHDKDPSPPHGVRKNFLEILGASVLKRMQRSGPAKVNDLAMEQGDEKVADEIPKIRFVLGDYRYGTFEDLPGTGAKADPDLKEAVQAAPGPEKIVNFLKVMAVGGEVGGFTSDKFLQVWNANSANANWVKEQFREVRPGRHEWIPTNYITRVLDVAIRSRNPDEIEKAAKWVTLQSELRSFTCDVIWDLRVTAETKEITGRNLSAHTGGFKENTYSAEADPIYHGDPKDRKLPPNPDIRIAPGGLRGMFESFQEDPEGKSEDAEGFLEYLEEKLVDGGLIWNGELDPNLPQEVYGLEVTGTYKHKTVSIDEEHTQKTVKVVEMKNISLQQLADIQVLNYARVLRNFGNAKTALGQSG
ncbi:phage tail protein [Streptomyces sp. 796.1]|uniref:phage tail protein n=1 Tax=Streptomyces sp. 796.1 TaxID=3163029 RepID=UPI0039C933C3